MTRAQFLNDMYRRLCENGMDRDQAEQHLTYYAEMLADRMEEGMTEEQAVSGMEDLETIVRRLLEEGLAYRPPEARVTPPEYPDASQLGGGGGTRAYQVPKKRNGQRTAQIALWTLAIVIALGAASRWVWMRTMRPPNVPLSSVDYATAVPVEEMAPYTEQYAYESGYYDGYGMNMPYEYGYEYSGGMNSYSGSAQKLDIEWAAGMVLVQSWSGEEIQFQEFSHSELTGRDMMVVENGGDELTIRYREGSSLGSVKGDKWLTVMVPDRMLDELVIRTTSAEVQLVGLEQGAIDVSTTSGCVSLMGCYAGRAVISSISGDINLSGLYANEMEVSTTSGDIYGNIDCGSIIVSAISGDVSLDAGLNTNTVQVSTTNGDIWLAIDNAAAQSIDVDTVSGSVSIGTPYDMGFTLAYDTISGDMQNNSYDMVQQNGKYVYNGGGCEIKVETVSGNLDIY